MGSICRLQTVVLTGNLIDQVEAGAFRHLPNIVTIVLTHNRCPIYHYAAPKDIVYVHIVSQCNN